MTIQHTSGPWHTGSWNNAIEQWIYGEDGYLISTCSRIEKRGAEESRANARLIAAAPELLYALEKMVFDTPRGADINYITIVDKARAVIAKAKGIV